MVSARLVAEHLRSLKLDEVRTEIARTGVVGILLWAIGHLAAVWAARRDPLFVEVVRRHLRIPAHLGL